MAQVEYVLYLRQDGGVWLSVPYKEKNDAKALGAWWDEDEKSWYIPPYLKDEWKKFRRWISYKNVEERPKPRVCLGQVISRGKPYWNAVAIYDKDLVRFIDVNSEPRILNKGDGVVYFSDEEGYTYNDEAESLEARLRLIIMKVDEKRSKVKQLELEHTSAKTNLYLAKKRKSSILPDRVQLPVEWYASELKRVKRRIRRLTVQLDTLGMIVNRYYEGETVPLYGAATKIPKGEL